jgi:hypothetical protein
MHILMEKFSIPQKVAVITVLFLSLLSIVFFFHIGISHEHVQNMTIQVAFINLYLKMHNLFALYKYLPCFLLFGRLKLEANHETSVLFLFFFLISLFFFFFF